MAAKKHFEVDNSAKKVYAIVASLTEKETKEVKTLLDLGFQLVIQEKEAKKKLSKEEKEALPFGEKKIQAFLKDKPEMYKIYMEKYNAPAIDSKTGDVKRYKTDSKTGKYKKGDVMKRGHIATLHWFKEQFPNYPN